MKRIFLLPFFLLSLSLFGQVIVVDGSDINSDIDSQSSTTLYQGTFEAPDSIWSESAGVYKLYLCRFYQQDPSVVIYSLTYPDDPSFDIPEVPVTISITNLDIAENTGGAYTQLEPGKTYYLEVLPFADAPLDPYIGQSDGVLITGGGEPPEDPSDDEPDEPASSSSGGISLSSSPSSLLFAAGEDANSLDLRISASGSGTITVDSIREDRIYSLWGEDLGFPESVNLGLGAGFTESLSRQVSMDNLERAKALGSGTEGSFTLRYLVSGRDAWGNPVSATLNIPVAVSGALSSTLNVESLSIGLPESPYFLNEQVFGSVITIEADGSGTALGQVFVDDSLGWSPNPTFTVPINGTTAFEIADPLPTDTAGEHTVRVDLISPLEMSAQKNYRVSDSASPFPPPSLTLIPEVAELSDFAGSAYVENIPGGVQYIFNGTASLSILSMDGFLLSQVTVQDLTVSYEEGSPDTPVILGGTVEKEGAGQVLASVAGGFMQIGQVRYDHAVDPGRLTARTNLNIPILMDSDYLTLDELAITRDGIALGSYSWDEGNAKTFNAFGVSFRIHDSGGNQALTIIEDAPLDRYGFSLSGSIVLSVKEGLDVQEKEIVSFSGLTFYTDGDFQGGITVSEDFELIPGMMTITSAGLALEGNDMSFKLNGEIKDLPSPLDELSSAFSLAFDTAGNLTGGLVPLDELSDGGRGLSENDSSEWSFGFATVDLTYVGLDLVIIQGTLMSDHSRVLIGADIYLDLLNEDGSAAGQENSRLGFGTVGFDENGQQTLNDGMEIAFSGDVSWPSLEGTVNLLSGKSLDLGAVKVSLDNLALEYSSEVFAFLFAGSFNLDVEAVEGGISFVNLRVSLNGDISGPDIQETDLSIMDFVSVRVGAVNWGSGPISYTEDQTTGEGSNRQPQIGEEPAVLNVDSYFEIRGASLNIGSDGSSIMKGSFEQMLFYSLNGETSFVLKEAEVETSGCQIFVDIKYDRSYMRVAGGITMQEISGAAVGKIGVIPDTTSDGKPEPRAGETTFGLFVMVEGLGIMVAPSVFLDSVGGGVFINPTNEDISTVLAVADFDRPELDDDIASMRPEGGGDPGSFAVMLLAGVYVAERTLVQGEALITLTANYFSLDADVTALEDTLHGRSYFLISWDPLYAEGNNVLEADLFDIFDINGDLAFYAYGEDAWGIMGGVQVSLMGDDMASGSFFIGPPGFMVETSVKSGIDIGLVSGYVQFSGMVWYYVVPKVDTWGAWAEVEVGGSLLWGLVSAKAGIEGALIGQGTNVLIYSVGSVSFEVCWIEVYSGSIWISIDGGGFDGGKGRNDRYDALIDEARNMADAVQSSKAELIDALSDAKLMLYQLNEEQRNAAGLALVERSGWVGQVLAISFEAAEVESWPGGIPNELEEIYELIFGEDEQALVELRTELEQMNYYMDRALEELESYQNQLLADLDEYEQIILEDLPGIRDLASSGNPFQGMETATVDVGNETRTVTVGFGLDENKVESQKEELNGIQNDFAEYQNAFIQRAELLDTKLSRLDEILFVNEQSFSALMGRYSSINSDFSEYMERFISYQKENTHQARENLVEIQYTLVPDDISDQFAGLTSAPTEQVVSELMSWTAASLNSTQIRNWNVKRIALIHLLQQAQGGEPDYSIDEVGLGTARGFIDTGMELWWYLPNSGWDQSIDLSRERIDTAKQSFHENGGAFRESWEGATGISDIVFDRKADLYTLLYEIYDQLAVYGSGTMEAVRVEPEIGLRSITPRSEPPDPDDKMRQIPITSYFEDRRDDIGLYLEFPVITEMSGELRNDDGDSAFFTGEFGAEHPVGIEEYAMKIGPGGSSDPWKSLGLDQQISDAFFPEYDIQRNYYFSLRARGAGGLAIERRGGFDLEFFEPEEGAVPFISNLDISDESPPTEPLVHLDSPITSDSQELYARWQASDPQSGIQRYEYAVGTFSAPEEPESDDGNVGFYLPGFGSALEPVAGSIGIMGEESVPADILPWTDAGGRTEVIIKDLDLQHGHEYLVSVRATNGVGQSSLGRSDPVLVDLTPPEGLEILEFIQEQVDEYLNSLKFEFVWSKETETEVLPHHVALGSAPGNDDYYPWTEVIYTFGRICNVPVPEGEPMYLSVKAINSVGLESEVSQMLEFSYGDNSAPPAPMVVTSPTQNSTDPSRLSIGWNGVVDPESGILSYSYGISHTQISDPSLEPDIWGWTEVGLSEGPYFFDKRISDQTLPIGDSSPEDDGGQAGGFQIAADYISLELADLLGTEYEVPLWGLNLSGRVYAVVKVTNGSGLTSIASSLPIYFDSTPPEYAEVTAESIQFNDNQLVCQLTAGDPESGIESYGYSITRIQEGISFAKTATRWVSLNAPPAEDVNHTVKIGDIPPPEFEYGGRYELTLWVRNRCGLSLSAGSVLIELVPPEVSKDDLPYGTGRIK